MPLLQLKIISYNWAIHKTLIDTAKLSPVEEEETKTSFLWHCQVFSVTQKDDSTTTLKLSTQTFEFLDKIPLFDEDNTAVDEDRLGDLPNELPQENLANLLSDLPTIPKP